MKNILALTILPILIQTTHLQFNFDALFSCQLYNKFHREPKQPQFQYQMNTGPNKPNPESSRNIQRFLADRYQSPYTGGVPYQGGMPYNYMLHSINQFYYPGYPCMNQQYMGSEFPSSMPNEWRDQHYTGDNIPMHPRNYPFYEFARVAARDAKEKKGLEVINLESDDEAPPALLAPNRHPTTFPKNQSQPAVIEIEDDSNQKMITEEKRPIIFQKNENKGKLASKGFENQKFKINDNKIKEKIAQLRQKPIKKQKKSEKEISKVVKTIVEKKNAEDFKIKKNEEVLKKKSERNSSKQSLPQAPLNSNKKIQYSEKIVAITEKKQQKDDKRQLAKYLESHGQIRHGKDFQSKIPLLQDFRDIKFHNWLEQKRAKLLSRETGAITF